MKKTFLVTALFAVITYVIGIISGYNCGKEDGREELNTELTEAAVKNPIYFTSKDGVRLVIRRETFESGLKQPVGFM